MIIALFEDESFSNLLPLTYTRPVFECRSGMFTMLERAQRFYQELRCILFARDYIAPTLRKRLLLHVNEPDLIGTAPVTKKFMEYHKGKEDGLKGRHIKAWLKKNDKFEVEDFFQGAIIGDLLEYLHL